MAKEIDIAFFSGNDVLLKFTVDDEDDPPNVKDITGATDITFAIAKAKGKTPVLSWTLGDGVTITDAAAGEFEVELTKAETEDLGPKHKYYEVRVTDSAGQSATVTHGASTISANSIST